MEYQKSKIINLKNHPLYNEKWLQEQIVADPSLLGLGELEVRDVERRQPRSGRLDLLLHDPESMTRYEVEIQLGATDESHIIRTIEYWDIEKTRYPRYDHIAVIVAEDITSRFLNVISLFNKAVPLVAIQMRALQIGETLTLTSVPVLNLTHLISDDDEDGPGQEADRAYWVNKGSIRTLGLTEQMLDLINTVSPGTTLKYNKHYIGLARNGAANLFVLFRPRKEYVVCEFRIERSEEVSALLESSDLDLMDYQTRWGRYRIRLTQDDLANRTDALLDLIRRASRTPVPGEVDLD